MRLKGTVASLGPKIKGKARMINSPQDIFEVQEGEIIITRGADMDLTVLFTKIAGIVTEEGGIMQHAAILAREFNIPCLVTVPKVADLIKTGQIITLDTQRGEIKTSPYE